MKINTPKPALVWYSQYSLGTKSDYFISKTSLRSPIFLLLSLLSVQEERDLSTQLYSSYNIKKRQFQRMSSIGEKLHKSISLNIMLKEY